MNQDEYPQTIEDEGERRWREWWMRGRIANNLGINWEGEGPSGVDFDRWLRRKTWTVEQVACLATMCNPRFFAAPPPPPEMDMGDRHAHTPEGKEIIHELIDELRDLDCPDRQPPAAWVRLFVREGLELPPQMEALLDAAIQDQDNAPAPTQETATTGKRKHTQERADRLAAVLNEIETRARECGIPLDRSAWPGTKAEFRAFLKWRAQHLSWILPSNNERLSDDLKPHGVTFLPGNNKGKGERFYKKLFPQYPAK